MSMPLCGDLRRRPPRRRQLGHFNIDTLCTGQLVLSLQGSSRPGLWPLQALPGQSRALAHPDTPTRAWVLPLLSSWCCPLSPELRLAPADSGLSKRVLREPALPQSQRGGCPGPCCPQAWLALSLLGTATLPPNVHHMLGFQRAALSRPAQHTVTPHAHSRIQTPRTSGCDCVWRQDSCRGDQVQMRPLEWASPSRTRVLIKG